MKHPTQNSVSPFLHALISIFFLTLLITACRGDEDTLVPGVTNRDRAWGTAKLIEKDDVGDATNPQVAFDSSGNAMVVWQRFDGTHNRIVTNRYVAGVGRGTVAQFIGSENGNETAPQVEADASGNVIVVWEEYDGTRSNVWANRYETGAGWFSPQLVEHDDTGTATYPRIAFDSDGNAIVVWSFSGVTSGVDARHT